MAERKGGIMTDQAKLEYIKKWQKENKEKRKEYNKKYYQKRKEKKLKS